MRDDGSEPSKSLLLLGILAGAVLFVILVVTVSPWWVAATAGLGVVLAVALADMAMYMMRQSIPM